MPFDKFKDTAVPLMVSNIDTDQIIPARFLKATTREGFGKNLFRDWRYDDQGSPKPDFVLNQGTFKGSILVVGENFGCGSSREHAAWALADFGFKVVISTFFADIFKNNALNNGLLPIVANREDIDELVNRMEANAKTEIEINLNDQTWSFSEGVIPFEINQFKKMCLLKGYSNMDYLASKKEAIVNFEKEHIYAKL